MHVVIPAGGAGTRLWPLSRRNHPKFLLDLLGTGTTLLQETVLRLLPVAQSVTVVTGLAHMQQVETQIQELQSDGRIPLELPIRVIGEPSGRDSMPAIGMATYLVRHWYGPDAVVGSFAADHDIQNPQLFRDSVAFAVDAAKNGFVSTIGLEPTEPSTAFGYIKRTDEAVGLGAFRVANFVEKPDGETAKRYVADGYLWNAGMFVMSCATFDSLLTKISPDLAETFQLIANRFDEESFDREEFVRVWESLPKIAIDHALAEPAAKMGRVAVAPMPSQAGWSDLGDFAALDQKVQNSHANALDPLVIDSDQTIVRTHSAKKVVVLGIPGAVVIDTPDALLVTTRENAQEIKQIPQTLQDTGFADLT